MLENSFHINEQFSNVGFLQMNKIIFAYSTTTFNYKWHNYKWYQHWNLKFPKDRFRATCKIWVTPIGEMCGLLSESSIPPTAVNKPGLE